MNYDELAELLLSHMSCDRTISKESIVESDLGLCSFDMISIVYEIERRAQIKLDLSQFTPEMSVGDLLLIVKKCEVMDNGEYNDD